MEFPRSNLRSSPSSEPPRYLVGIDELISIFIDRGDTASTTRGTVEMETSASSQAIEGSVSVNRGSDKPKKRRSPIFAYIKQAEQLNKYDLLEIVWICVLCKAPKVSPVWTTDGTTNMWDHLKVHHPEEHALISPADAASDNKTSNASQPSFGASERARSNAILIRWIAKFAHLFSIVEQDLFCDFCASLREGYVPPCRQTVATQIRNQWVEAKERVRQTMLSEVSRGRRSSVTTDMWTSSAGKGYMAVTLHYITPAWRIRAVTAAFVRVVYPHTGERLARAFFKALGDLDPRIASTVWSITADNASNNVTMIAAVNEEIATQTARRAALRNAQQGDSQGRPGLEHFGVRSVVQMRCLAHVLQLAIKEGLKQCPAVNEALGGLRDVAKKMLDSPKMFEKYEKICNGYENSARKFELDVPTRWNSTYDMVDVLIKSRQPLEDLLYSISRGYEGYTDLVIDSDSSMRITEASWEVAELYRSFLSLFKNATEMLSGSTYPTLGAVVGVYNTLKLHTQKSVEETTHKVRGIEERLATAVAVAAATTTAVATAAADSAIEASGLVVTIRLPSSDVRSNSSPQPRANQAAGVPSVSTQSAQHAVEKLEAHLVAVKRDLKFFTGVHDKMIEYNDRVINRETRIACTLDPRSKVSAADPFSRSQLLDEFYDNYAARYEAEKENQSLGIMSLGIMSPPCKYQRFVDLLAQMTGGQRSQTTPPSIEKEVDHWFASPGMHADKHQSRDVSQWFATNQPQFPRLSMMARDFLAVPATSVLSEAVFSKAGSTIHKRRAQLDDKSVQALLELQSFVSFNSTSGEHD